MKAGIKEWKMESGIGIGNTKSVKSFNPVIRDPVHPFNPWLLIREILSIRDSHYPVIFVS
jgi:hypothetical protein